MSKISYIQVTLRSLLKLTAVLIPLIIGGFILPAHAHEFWLEPDDYTPTVGAKVSVSHVIGQNFKGTSYPYVKDWFERYIVADADGERPIDGVEGDDPAVALEFASGGLRILAHQSTASTLTMETFAEFEKYLVSVGLDHIVTLHRKQGKPETAIEERYARCAKTLISVGGAAGSDRAVGLPLELIAEKNPYQLADGEALPVLLLSEGQPLGAATIVVFSKTKSAEILRVQTDRDGRALVPLAVGHTYLLNAVHMVATEPGDDAHWQSLWASLTFARR